MEIPHQFIPATKAKAEEVNENFQAVKESIEDCVNKIIEANANSNSLTNTLKNYVYNIGSPVITLASTLNDNEIWLEGGEVSKETYNLLYEIYGDTYGTPNDSNNFVLPDFRGRTVWGATEFGYINAGLPNITGALYSVRGSDGLSNATGALYNVAGANNGCNSGSVASCKDIWFDASRSSSIYGKSSTVQPPSVKVRVKTRYA